MGIELSHLNVSLGKTTVLEDFSLTLPQTGLLCLLGPSGSGKTTLLRLLAGLIAPESGHVTGLQGRRLSMVFQEDRLLPWCSALENVALPCGDSEKAREVLAALGLEDALEKQPNQLSGGMCRRVALARALAFGGEVYLMDEPLKGLDAALKERVMAELHARTKGALVLLVTHEQGEALALADELLWFSGTPLHLSKREQRIIGYNERKTKNEFSEEYKSKEQ